MDDEDEFYRYDSTDDTEEVETETPTHPVKRVLASLGYLLVMGSVGYLLGYAFGSGMNRVMNGVNS